MAVVAAGGDGDEMMGVCAESSPPSPLTSLPPQRQKVISALHKFFRHVEPFPDYLARVTSIGSTGDMDSVLRPPSVRCTSAYIALTSSLIATNVEHPPTFPLPSPSDRIDMDVAGAVLCELVERAQSRLVQQQRGALGSNMLTLGLKKADDRAIPISMIGQVAINETHANECVMQIKTGFEWQELLCRLGAPIVEHLFMSTAMFLPLNASNPQSNYVQVLGNSVSNIERLPEPAMTGAADAKQVKANSESSHSKKIRRRRNRKSSDNASVSEASSRPGFLLKRKRDDIVAFDDQCNELRKKTKLADQRRHAPIASVDLLRSRIFYAKATRTSSGRISAGLPFSHILVRLRSVFPAINEMKSPSVRRRQDTKHTKLLAKYIWPREHKLQSIWTSSLDGTGSAELGSVQSRKEAFELRRMLDSKRQPEIDAARDQRRRTPKRISRILPLLAIMQRKFNRLDVRRALDLCCPSRLPRRKLTHAERETILVDLCEVGDVQTQYFTQRHYGFSRSPSSVYSEAEERMVASTTNEKPHFLKYRTSYGCVGRFVRLVLREIVPLELFGSCFNRSLILRAVDRFICARRLESVSLHEVCQGFRLLDCEWLLPEANRALQQRPTSAEMIKRQDLMYEFIFWLFDGLVVPLLRTNFYATESAKYRNRVLFFRQQDWYTMTQPILETLQEKCFDRLERHKALALMSRREFGYSFVRLLPKEIGVRPIVNLRRKSSKVDHRKEKGFHLNRQKHSINNILRSTFHVLDYEKRDNPMLSGSTVTSAQEIFHRLKTFKKRLRQRFGQIAADTPLYFVKIDVAGAFDCIDQSKLLAVVEDVIRHDRYVIQRYTKILSASSQRPLRTWRRWACSEEDHEYFNPDTALQIAATSSLRNAVLSNGVTHAYCDREHLLWLIREHVENNLIRIGKDFYRQRIGIPQGSTLSSTLCCYYLACMERELHLVQQEAGPEDGSESLLMRYVDDFLFISSDIDEARRFFNTMHKGGARFNCSIAAEKSICNFRMLCNDMDDDVLQAAANVQCVREDASGHSDMPWCGHRIDTRTLAVTYDIERYVGTFMGDTLTIPMRTAFESVLKHLVTNFVQRNSVRLYLDVGLNGIDGVLGNVYESFMLSAMKFLSALSALQKRFGKRQLYAGSAEKSQRLSDMILKIVHDNVDHCYAHTCTRMNAVDREDDEADVVVERAGNADTTPLRQKLVWPVQIDEYRWLALHAIHAIFSTPSRCTKRDPFDKVAQVLDLHLSRIQRKIHRRKSLRGKNVQELRQVARQVLDRTRHARRKIYF